MLLGLFVGLCAAYLHSCSALCKDCTRLEFGVRDSPNKKKFLEWEDVFNATLAPKYAGIYWTKSGHTAYEASSNGYWKVDPKTGDQLVQYFSAHELYGLDFEVSADEEFAIVYEITRYKYRHSFYANYSVVNLTDPIGSRRNVTINPTGKRDDVQYCGFSPTGHTLVVVAGFNLYTKKEPMDENAVFVQHTFDGQDNIIFNGVPDWVYEEEVVGDYYSNYPSPDSRFIAFTKTNATGVRHVRFPIYGDKDYATILDYEYPKAGYKNPTISTWVVDLEDDNTDAYQIPTPDEVIAWGEHYLYTVSWANSETVVLEWWNREQTKISFQQCHVHRGSVSCTEIFKEDSQGVGWLDWWDHPLWYFDGLNKFATLLPSNQGEEGNFKHICLFTQNTDGTWERNFLTSGTYDVLSIYAQLQDSGRQYLFYQASKGGQMHRHVFQLDVNTGESQCLSCDGYCGYASASFSADATMYRLTCYGPVPPYVQLMEVDTNWISVLEANHELVIQLRDFNLCKHEYMVEEIGGFGVNVQRISPPDFDENGTKRYPVLVYVYGGPDSANVLDKYPFGAQRKDFHHYLANGAPGKPNFLVYNVDVRGTVGRGDDFRFPLYRKFGITEVDDTLDFLEKLRQYHYVDDARMAIWGWSYGGFLSAKVAGSTRKLVQAAISVAPVTSYHFYDTIYTERYMGLPKDNPAYETGGCLHEAANFAGTDFFLIHGSADDNVHYTNAARLAYNLVENEIDFRMHAYTDKAHSLKGSATRRHLYTMIKNFLYEKLNLQGDYLDYYS